jgi:hypothetical protein
MNTRLNLLFVLADVMEHMMVESTNELHREGLEMRFGARQAFRQALFGLRKLQREVTGCATHTQDDFCLDSDMLYATLLVYTDATGDDNAVARDIYRHLRSYPSRVEGLAPASLDEIFSAEEGEETAE